MRFSQPGMGDLYVHGLSVTRVNDAGVARDEPGLRLSGALGGAGVTLADDEVQMLLSGLADALVYVETEE